jgi:hypothetical protein
MDGGGAAVKGRPWTSWDDERLRWMLGKGIRASAVGIALGRSEGAVRVRMHRLGIFSGLAPREKWRRRSGGS